MSSKNLIIGGSTLLAMLVLASLPPEIYLSFSNIIQGSPAAAKTLSTPDRILSALGAALLFVSLSKAVGNRAELLPRESRPSGQEVLEFFGMLLFIIFINFIVGGARLNSGLEGMLNSERPMVLPLTFAASTVLIFIPIATRERFKLTNLDIGLDLGQKKENLFYGASIGFALGLIGVGLAPQSIELPAYYLYASFARPIIFCGAVLFSFGYFRKFISPITGPIKYLPIAAILFAAAVPFYSPSAILINLAIGLSLAALLYLLGSTWSLCLIGIGAMVVPVLAHTASDFLVYFFLIPAAAIAIGAVLLLDRFIPPTDANPAEPASPVPPAPPSAE